MSNAELAGVLADLVAGPTEPIGVLASDRVWLEFDAPESVALVRGPEEVGASHVAHWIVADLPGLLLEDPQGTSARLALIAQRSEPVTVLASNSARRSRDLEAIRRGTSLLIENTTAVSISRALNDLGWEVISVAAAGSVAELDGLDPASLSPLSSETASLRRFVDSTVRRASLLGGEAAVMALTARPLAAGVADLGRVDDEDDQSPGLRPFLSVIMRTQGRRECALAEALLGLSAQTNCDFELLIVGHDLSAEADAVIRALVTEFPVSFGSRVRHLRVNGGGRSTPLNAGVEAARGRYVAMFDDDDVPFAHWVETFALIAARSPGKVARCDATNQATGTSQVDGYRGVRALHSLVFPYSERYNLAEHLVSNGTPNMAVAIPRGAFTEYGLRFDDTLSTHEDWELVTRAASLFGTDSEPECTALYHWWLTEESSRTVQTDSDREHNVAEVRRRQAADGVLFLGEDVETLRESMQGLTAARAELAEQRASAELSERALRSEWERRLRVRDEYYADVLAMERRAAQATIDRLEQEHLAEIAALEDVQRVELLKRLAAMLRSRRWRYTRPLRLIQQFRRGASEPRIEDFLGLSKRELHDVIYDVSRSRSWRLVATLRQVERRLRA